MTLICVSVFFSSACAAIFHTSNNHIINYTESGTGTPLVLIHAFPTDLRLWESQTKELSKYFHVITLDLLGFGKASSVDGSAVTMIDYADEVNELLEQLNIHKAIIGGESMGGYVALAFLEKYPDKTQGMILSDTQSIADSEETKTKREATAQDVLQNGTATFINNFMPKALSSNASEQTKQFLRNILESQDATAIASASRGMALRKDTSDLLSHSTLPILILTGDQDVLINPGQGYAMHLLAKNSKFVMLYNAGHISSLEQPEQWNRAVIDFFLQSKNIKMSH